MTNPSLDPTAQSTPKHQSNSHQAAPAQQQPVSQSKQKKSWTGLAGKTLWDWLGVLLVPFILGTGTIIVTAQQSAISQSQYEVDLKIANDQLQENILKTYRDDINHLVFDQHLLTAKPYDPVQNMAQSYTNDALRKLDLSRRVMLVRFLSDMYLITSNRGPDENPPLMPELKNGENSPLISLYKANLRGADIEGTYMRGANLQVADLGEADLHGANLEKAFMQGTNLRGTYMRETNLKGVYLGGNDLQRANLQRADLRGANLQFADMRGADLAEADLHGANLEWTNLRGAKVTPKQLAEAYRLKNAILPDGSRYPSSSYPIPNHQEPPD